MATVRAVVDVPLSGVEGPVKFFTFHGLSGPDHFAVRFGDPMGAPLVRVHSECATGDILGSLRCDCGSQLQHAMRLLDEHSGWLLYLRQEGRGIGLAAKLDAYVLQDAGLDTFAANVELGFEEDARRYDDVAMMLSALGVHKVSLLTNNSEKADAIRRCGVELRSVVACPGRRSPFNAAYLEAKQQRSRAQSQVDLAPL